MRAQEEIPQYVKCKYLQLALFHTAMNGYLMS